MAKKGEEKIPTEEEHAAYETLVQQQSARPVEVPTDKKEKEKSTTTISEAMEMSTDLTDMQFGMSELFPKVVGDNSVMIARIAPEVFLPMLHLKSVNEIMKSDPTKSIDVNRTYERNYDKLSIGLDGRGRIDIAEILGATREEKKAEKLLGGAGGI